jgi:hypothetical protein
VVEEAGQAGLSRTTLLREHITPAMIVAGACVLEDWMEGDEDYAGLSVNDLVAEIYAAMAAGHQTHHPAPKARPAEPTESQR